MPFIQRYSEAGLHLTRIGRWYWHMREPAEGYRRLCIGPLTIVEGGEEHWCPGRSLSLSLPFGWTIVLYRRPYHG